VRRRTETRDRLVTTAAELFWSRGYAHTGVSAIMKRARATSGSFYHFFPTKDDLLLAVLDEVAEKVEIEVLGHAEQRFDSADGRISGLAEAYRETTTPATARFGLPIGALIHEFGPDLEQARRRVAGIYEHVVARVSGWLADDPQVAISSTGRRRLAESVVAALEGAGLMAAATGSSEPVDAVTELVFERLDGPPVRPVRGDADAPPTRVETGDWKAW
jgi:TetR/AcrR family transcriptional repressor of nem operon